jgi:PBSX family phage portal protein
MREMLLKATVYGAGDRYVPASSVMQPDDEQRFVELGALPPPYNPSTLAMLVEHSDALRQCIDAYSVNIEAFGHRWEPVIDLESDDAKEKLRAAMEMESGGKAEVSDAEVDERFEVVKREMRREKLHLESFFEFCSLDSSFPELRQKTRFDQETHGNAYWEVLRNAAGDVVQFVYVPGHTVRLLPLAKDPVEVDVQVRVSPLKFLKIKTPRRLRKYVQIVEPTAARTVYFKEFGDTRVMSQKSGAYFEDEAALKKADPEDFPANEIIHFRIHSPRSAYGVPRWIGTLLAVLGSRMAEEVNYLYFSNKSVPPLAILVSGGRVNDETAKRIEEFIETQIKGKANFHKILVLDAAAIDDGSINSGRAKIDIKPLTMAQHNDALFQEYQKQNTEKVGSAMRLPRILRGDSREVNRATAEAALSFAEIQVFSPQRESFDFMINRQVLSQMGVRYWRFRSNAPSLRDPAALAGVVRDLVNAGVLTPAEARELAEGIFNREFRVIAADWTRLPMQLTLAGFTSDGGAPEPLAPGEFPPGAPPLPGTGAAGTPGEKHPPASQGSGVTPPVKGAEWLKRVRAKLRRGDVSGVVEDLVAVRDQLRAREAIEADVEFRKLASVK